MVEGEWGPLDTNRNHRVQVLEPYQSEDKAQGFGQTFEDRHSQIPIHIIAGHREYVDVDESVQKSKGF